MLFTKNRLYSQYYDISEARRAYNSLDYVSQNSFDIFLSHSYDDKKYIYNLFKILTNHNLSVYVDWIIDSELDRSHVTKDTAELIRKRMQQSKCLLYATSLNASDSKWMPWELGYFDGYSKGKVAIIPIVDNENSSFYGQEYLSLYPYIDEVGTTLWVNKHDLTYHRLDEWFKT